MVHKGRQKGKQKQLHKIAEKFWFLLDHCSLQHDLNAHLIQLSFSIIASNNKNKLVLCGLKFWKIKSPCTRTYTHTINHTHTHSLSHTRTIELLFYFESNRVCVLVCFAIDAIYLMSITHFDFQNNEFESFFFFFLKFIGTSLYFAHTTCSNQTKL